MSSKKIFFSVLSENVTLISVSILTLLVFIGIYFVLKNKYPSSNQLQKFIKESYAGLGTDYKIYTSDTLSGDWKGSVNDTTFSQILQLSDGTYAGISLINLIQNIPNSRGVGVDMWCNYNENNLLESIWITILVTLAIDINQIIKDWII